MNRKSIKHAVASIAVVGAALGVTLNAVPAAHAGGGSPTIAASVKYGSILHVTGTGFGAGDTVLVEAIDNDSKLPVAFATTQASVGSPPCQTRGLCLRLIPGFISTDLPSVYVHCGYEYVAVVALDLTNPAMSNSVQETLGYGPC